MWRVTKEKWWRVYLIEQQESALGDAPEYSSQAKMKHQILEVPLSTFNEKVQHTSNVAINPEKGRMGCQEEKRGPMEVTVGFFGLKAQRKLKILIKTQKRIHVNLINWLVYSLKILTIDAKTIRSLEGQEEVHTSDTLPRAFRFLGRIKTSLNEHVLHKYPHEQP